MRYTGNKSVLQNSIFDIFRGGNAQPQPAAPAPNAAAPNPNANPNDPGNNAQQVPQTTTQQKQNDPTQDGNKSPLAEFAGLWDTPTPKDGEVVEPNWDEASSLVPETKIDPKKLVEAAKRIDFSKLVDPALAEKALKQGDATAFAQILNSVAQAAMANMAMSSSKMMEAKLRQVSGLLIEKALPHHMRKHTVSAQVSNDLPIFNDPAVAPMLSMLEQQMRTKYPKASPAEISSKAKQMLTGMAGVITGTSGTTTQTQNKSGAKAEPDWDAFLTS